MKEKPSTHRNAQDRALLNALQAEFPLVERPWAALGEKLGRAEDAILEAVRAFSADGLVRQIGPIFDSRQLGYQSCLVAARVAAEQLEAVAVAVNRHPGVSHNYQRDHAFNLWFTMAVAPGRDLEAEVRRLTGAPGVQQVRLLPVLRRFKIDANLDLERDETEPVRVAAPTVAGTGRAGARPARLTPPAPLSDRDRSLIRVTQQNLPLDLKPFATLASRAGVEADVLLAWLRGMVEQGFMRRFGAVLRHRQAGFTENGMIAWRAPEARIEEAGGICATFPQVSHCYQRATYPDWPYGLLTMVHARSRENCEHIARRIAAELRPLGVTEHVILYSVKEFKKERVKYFLEAEPCGAPGERA